LRAWPGEHAKDDEHSRYDGQRPERSPYGSRSEFAVDIMTKLGIVIRVTHGTLLFDGLTGTTLSDRQRKRGRRRVGSARLRLGASRKTLGYKTLGYKTLGYKTLGYKTLG
jgi:hypothetical protein